MKPGDMERATCEEGGASGHRCLGVAAFGSSQNTHVHFHVCVVDGVFEAQSDGVTFHAAAGVDEAAVAWVQASVRKRILRAFVARRHLDAHDARGMAGYAHGGGFSVLGRCRGAH